MKTIIHIRQKDIRETLVNHVKMRDYSVARRRGIGGAHDMTEFAKYSGEYQIVSKTPHPSVPGVWKIEYRTYARDKTGAVTSKLKAKIYQKTVYDPNVWTDDKAIVEAAQDALSKGTFLREWTGVTKEGYKIRDYQEKGKISSFFFD